MSLVFIINISPFFNVYLHYLYDFFAVPIIRSSENFPVNPTDNRHIYTGPQNTTKIQILFHTLFIIIEYSHKTNQKTSRKTHQSNYSRFKTIHHHQYDDFTAIHVTNNLHAQLNWTAHTDTYFKQFY